MVSASAHERKHEQLTRQIGTARLIVSQYDDLIATIRDPYAREMAWRYRGFWLDVLARRQAEMTGGERQAGAVKA